MNPRLPIYRPLTARFLALLGGILALSLFALELGLATSAYERLGIHHRTAIALLAASLLGSWLNLPIARFPDVELLSGRSFETLGVRYTVPVVERWPGTILALNVGGAVIPVLLSAALALRVGHLLELAAVIGVVALFTHAIAKPVPGVGIVVPALLPPLGAAGAALWLAPDVPAAAAYVGGTLGTLLGADVANLGRIRSLGAPVASIGGAGTFDAIFVTGIVAVLIA